MSTDEIKDNSLGGTLARLDERTERMEDSLKSISEVLLTGNGGSPALTVQVATLNADMSNLKAVVAEHRIPRSVWIPLVITVLVAVIGIIVSLKNVA